MRSFHTPKRAASRIVSVSAAILLLVVVANAKDQRPKTNTDE